MKEEICAFAMKMIQEGYELEEIMDHVNECLVCQKIDDEAIFKIMKDLGVDLKEGDND